MPTRKKHSSEYLGKARDYWWNDDYLDLLAKRLRLKDCRSLLDAGCGKGYLAFRLAKYLKAGADIYGFDAEAAWVREANDRAVSESLAQNKRFEFKRGDAYRIPFQDDSMDVTACQTLLIHLAEPQKAVAEMARVTRPGGRVVAFEPDNAVNALMLDSLNGAGMSVEKKLKKLEACLRMEAGKAALGEGYNSLGDLVPELFHKAGLKDIRVWICDRAGALIPPYDTDEKKAIQEELLGWIRSNHADYNYEESLRYYLAGGGKKAAFDRYWLGHETEKQKLADALTSETYISPGGQMLFIVAGTKPE
jgi:ubiquinone/menaquinone biosynthesis C-methylase UbiE